MKGAVIDMGTNSFNLLVYEKIAGKRIDIASGKIFVNIGEGGINKKQLTQDAINRAYKAIEEFVQICDEYSVTPSNIVAFGTSALRDAGNVRELLNKLENNLGVRVKLIDGIQEAEIVFAAVNEIHPFSKKSSCIMDIGGGSTEFTLVNNGQIQQKYTFDIGLSRIIQKYKLEDPLSKDNIDSLNAFLEGETHAVFNNINVEEFIGVGGSFETYYHMINKTFDYEYTQTYLLPRDKLMKVLEELIYSTQVERNQNDWIVDFRKSMINVAALKTKWALEQTNAKFCCFSPASLKEGVISGGF